ncbi:MAG: sulfatase [Bacteroidales bacterium]|nr:sulfatase [Bacteroidales bacterium]
MNKIQSTVLLSAAALSGAAAAAQPVRPRQEPAEPDNRLNVLFISSDDLCSAMNAFGDPRVQTPNLDRLARMGVVFNRAYNQSPLSGPSRASIMTGCRPDRTGVHDLSGKFRYAMPDAVTLPQLFKNNGYYTVRVGKIYHAGVPSDIGQPGSDDPASWTIAYNPIGRDRTDEYLLEGNTHPGTWMALDCNDNEMTDGISANVAVSLLRSRYSNVGSAYGGPARKDAPVRRAAQPFFMAVGFYRPHIPYIAPQKYFDLYPEVTIPENFEQEWLTKPDLARNNTSWNGGVSEEDCLNAVRAYYASITFIDAQIGKMLDALEELDLMDKTIIVFWSDHGYMLGDHGMWQKQNLFERTAHQPLLIYAPGVTDGKQCNAVVEMIDIYPTVAELAALPAPGTLDGVSLKPLLDDVDRTWDRPAFTQQARTLYGEGQNNAMMRAFSGGTRFMFNPSLDDSHTTVFGRSVRTDRYRYTEWDEGREGVELYDYETDPEEHVNLAHNPDRKTRNLMEELAALLHSSYDKAAIEQTQKTIARNRAAANQSLEPLYPRVTY